MPVLDRSLATYYDGFHLTPTGARDVANAVAAAVLAPTAEIRVERTSRPSVTAARKARRTVSATPTQIM
jgi:hypothetical protein